MRAKLRPSSRFIIQPRTGVSLSTRLSQPCALQNIARGSCGHKFPQCLGVDVQCKRYASTIVEKEPEYVSGTLSGYDVFHQKSPFKLRNGQELPELQIAYESWGRMNSNRDNVILLQCGMSASSHAKSHEKNPAPGWWEDYIGPGRTLDTNLFHVICTNNLGGCYGSSGPSSFHPDGRRYGSRFPRFQVYDQVAAQFQLLTNLGVQRVHACVGSSLGGMQSVCAAATYPDRVAKFVSISAAAKSFPGSIAFRHAQRRAIMTDPNWNDGDYYDGELPAVGLRLAREIGTITYRSGKEWQMRFGQGRMDEDSHPIEGLDPEFHIEQYLQHQGSKWVNAYDPNSMLWISKAMDGFSLERPDKSGSPSLVVGLSTATMPALIIGVQQDVLFPVWQQKEIADSLRAAGNKHVIYYELDSVYGHDTFLLDKVSIGAAVKGHLEQEPGGARHIWEEMASSSTRVLQAMLAKTQSADGMRDMFRALAGTSDSVEEAELRGVVKVAFQGRIEEAEVDRIFAEADFKARITLKDFMKVVTTLLHSDDQVPVI